MKKSIKTVTYDIGELAAFREAATGPAAKAWIKANMAKGLPAQELYDFVTGMIGQ